MGRSRAVNYIITSFAYPRRDNEPQGWESLFTSFELGWEVTTTHLLAKRMFIEGIAKPKTHTIVTLAGREFLYEGIGCEVMSWDRFFGATRYDALGGVYGNVIDLARRFALRDIQGSFKLFNGSPSFRYRWPSDWRYVVSTIGAASPVPFADAPFAVACWRYREGHFSCRNTPREVAEAINESLVDRGLDVYVVGLGCEPLCDGKRIKHASLKEMAWLVRDDNCKAVVGAMTGTTQLAALMTFAPVSVYQHNPRQPVNCQNHPAVLGDCVRFNENKRRVWFADETPVEDFIAAYETS